jgi:hypothetical protein
MKLAHTHKLIDLVQPIKNRQQHTIKNSETPSEPTFVETMGDQPGSTVLFSRNPDKHELILSGWLVKLGNGNFVLFGCSNPLHSTIFKK